MRGTIIKRYATYSVVIDLGKDPVTGARRRKWHNGFKTKKAAERARVDLLAKVDTGTYVQPSRQTFSEYLDEWLGAIAHTVRPATIYSYRRNLDLHARPYLGHLPLHAVDAGALNSLYGQLLTNGRADGSGGLSPRSVRYVSVVLHRAFKDAMRWGRLLRNPVDASDPPAKGPRYQITTWPEEVLATFLTNSAAYGDRYYPLWVTLATTGARRGEVLGLRWSDLDLVAGTASIRQTVVAVAHEVMIGSPKTQAGERTISLDADTVAVLRAWKARQAAERLALGSGYSDHGLVFPKLTGEPLHPERASREFTRRVERWSLPYLTLHGLRHTWATLALEAKVHPVVVKDRLGHSTITVTLDLYTHSSPRLDAEAAATVAAKVLGR